MKLLVLYKLYTRKIFKICGPSYCKNCGRNIHDFSTSDEIWEKIEPYIKYGHVLCYDCFCEICSNIGLPSVWKLEEIKDKNDN